MKNTSNKPQKLTKESIGFIRDFFLKPDDMHNFAHDIAMRAYPESIDETYPIGVRETLVVMAMDNIENNIAAIHAHAESPIEILFLSALCISFMFSNPFDAAFTPPISPDFPGAWRENHEAALEMWRIYQETQEGSEHLSGLLQFIEEFKGMLERQDCSQDEVNSAVTEATRHLLLYHMLGMKHSYHFSLQSSLVANEKTIRPDIYVWVPSRPNFKLIVECDGFEHHTNRAAFSRDRARDRSLQTQGFQVFRFSGHEIYHDPVSASMELFEYLMSMHTQDRAEDRARKE